MIKYTYQAWREGKSLPPDLTRLVFFSELTEEDYIRISGEQHKAFKYVVESELKQRIERFLYKFDETALKSHQIELEILGQEEGLAKKKEQFPDAYDIAASNHLKVGEGLTYKEIQKIYSKDNKESEFVLAINCIDSPLRLIVDLEFLQWLKWLHKKEKKAEDVLFSKFYENACDSNHGDILENNNWSSLFKDPTEADKILDLIAEHLSSSGQWLTEPKGRYMVALCTELEYKGYFKNTSNTVKASSFNAQFGLSLNQKNFQPNRRGDADFYRENFSCIPPYKPKKRV
ncbi:hypothetical protein [Pontibacter fetidus]|uniref:Uncharacterized protein n=1 Tax=Pontibacter fetidus TaxID=2700082 RepID=A0A6B2H396_9BACT|nr:hypothetical protein [Pontibacter fetidus]NDK56813.1 hypothetical protein [Pontibacter fetidus]